MAESITATAMIRDFARWTGCSSQQATAVLRATACPDCAETDPLANVGPCTHVWHMRADSGDWSAEDGPR